MSAPATFESLPGPPGTRFATLRWFDEIDSTNRYVLDEARAGAPDGTVALAAHQRAGRGRLDRRWEAPPGANVLMSVLLRPDVPADELHLCTVALSLASLAACTRVDGMAPELKWPNDLVVGERKLAGILAEVAPPSALARVGVVMGIGLNVRWPTEEAPADAGAAHDAHGVPDRDTSRVSDEVRLSATSLRRETGQVLDPLDVARAVLSELEPRLVELETRRGRRQLAAEYRRRCATVGRTVRVSLADESFVGTAVDITVEGHLVVDVGACLRTLSAGDVVHVRAAG